VLSVDRSYGVPFSDTFKSDTLWEYYAPEPDASQVIMAFSFRIIWVKKVGNLVKSVISSTVDKKLRDGVSCAEFYFEDKAREYRILK